MADVKTEVVRDLSAIKAEITGIKTEVKGTKSEIRELDKALKLDPTNVELINKRFDKQKYLVEQLNKEIKAHIERQKAWKVELDKNVISVDKYNNSIKSEQIEIDKLTRQVNNLTSKYSEQNRVLAVNSAANKNNIENVTKFESALSKVSKVIMVAVAAITALSYSTIQLGAELNDIAKKYGITAEELQKQRNLYKQLTNDEKIYENALKSLSNVIRSLNRGAGETKAFESALKDLGISSKEISKMTSGEAFEVIFNALQKVTDASTRANIAMILFGDNGLAVATVAGESAETINALNKSLEDAGIISNYDAEKLKELQTNLGYVKTSFQTLMAEILVELAPLLLSFFNTLKNIANFLKTDFGKTLLWIIGISSSFALILNITTKAYKALLTFQSAYLAVKKAEGTLTTWATLKQMLFNAQLWKTIALMAAITGGASLLIGAIGAIGASAYTAGSDMDELNESMESVQESLDNLGTAGVVTTRSVAESKSSKKVDINIDLNAHGDTPISQENANIVSISIDKELQKTWGNLI